MAYEAALRPFFELTGITEGSEPAYSTFVIRHDERDALMSHLAAKGFDVKIHYPIAIHQQAAFAGTSAPALPITEALVGRIISLPVTPELEPSDRDALIDALIQWSRSHA